MRVELDGAPWRTLSAAAVVAAGLRVGVPLDRERARELARALRRSGALEIAGRALARRDRSVAELAARLERQGVAPAEREGAIETMTRLGILDDERFAASRAAALAGRGYGDEAIRFELERQGIGSEWITAAIDALAPELARAQAIAARAGVGAGPEAAAVTARRLAAKGFGAEAVESILARLSPE